MFVHRSFRVALLCAAASLVLVGCVTSVAPSRPLVTPGTANASEVAVAVETNGTKHYLWTECTTSGANTTCPLVYARTLLGTVTYQYVFTAVEGAHNRTPDIAVTADGRAFIVRGVCTSANVCTDYYSIIPSVVTDSTIITSEPLASPANTSTGAPKVKARGNVVYAVYEVPAGPGPVQPTELRYRQLSGGTGGGNMTSSTIAQHTAPSLAIDSNAKLHVAWYARSPSGPERTIFYANNITVNPAGDMILSAGGAVVTSSLSYTDLALAGDNTAYFVYSADNGSSDVIQIIKVAGGTSGTITIPLTSATAWRVRGTPQIGVFNDKPTVVFSADNSVTSNNEIWSYTPPASGPDAGPVRITTNSVQDGEPLLVSENSTAGDVPVVAWRTYTTDVSSLDDELGLAKERSLLGNDTGAASSSYTTAAELDCYNNAYMFYFNRSTLRQIHTGQGGCFNNGQALAAKGQWVAGIWTDKQSSSSTRLVPWTAFNANMTYVPSVAK